VQQQDNIQKMEEVSIIKYSEALTALGSTN